MAGRNGVADVETAEDVRPSVGVLKLDDIAYERATMMVTMLGEPMALSGWVQGPGCPGTVKAEFARKHRAMLTAEDDPGAAYHEFLIDALRIIFDQQLSYQQADVLAGDVERAERILRHYRWYQEEPTDPEATGEGETSTTATSSPTSPDATAASAPTAAAG